jgi:hypothetical protein
MSAKLGAKVMVQQGMKYCIFVSQSTTTHIASCPSNHGSPAMKSIKILVHGIEGTERDLRI